ncbi:tRNA threonylcarbamoyladenosine dehydratase [Actomonas aquatica]|uniref:tRNA threonylcarbamoyladenosine dehydratase n=1 Tax=Actomonas aquatica TaxID=2866162 RepID=A0ABZ1CE45_9BACT|nr:tRNA threonylcarbamoyladenosine dehydratase [Opitutus sp. WL0086]WRQ89701.1 tRNA threonylcarbamoyladenosine dehydratase [Opitutus sp. WL0086]
MNSDYADRFGGVGRLFGAAALERLQAAHVVVIGVGGVGSWTVEGLARSGVGHLTLIDLDDLCITNTNRQLPALDGNLGRPKVEALAERVRLINPSCVVSPVSEYITASNADRLLAPEFDIVVDAIDGTTNKADLIAACVRLGKRCVTVGGAGGKRDAAQLRVGDLGEAGGDELLKMVRRKLRKDHGFARGEGNRYGVRCVWSAEKPVYPWADGTCSTEAEPGSNLKLDCASGFGTAVWVTGAMGLTAAQEAVRWLAE